MTCDKIWRNCFFRHIDIPVEWRNKDADVLLPKIQDVFWIECSVQEVKDVMANLIRDFIHLNRIEEAVKSTETHGGRIFHFLATRHGMFAQYYPLMTFNDPGSAWESIGPIKFESFAELEKVYPKSTPYDGSISRHVRGNPAGSEAWRV